MRLPGPCRGRFMTKCCYGTPCNSQRCNHIVASAPAPVECRGWRTGLQLARRNAVQQDDIPEELKTHGLLSKHSRKHCTRLSADDQ